MKIAVYGRTFDVKHLPQVQKLFAFLSVSDTEVCIYESFHNFLSSQFKLGNNTTTFKSHSEIRDSDFMFSIGGDGTLLDTLAFVRDSGVPVLGFNTGRLGFLSGTPMDTCCEALDDLFKHNYTIDQRSLLRLETPNNLFGEVNFALNELTLHKKDSATMMTIHTYINGEYLNSYWADGLIVSTPTGSTAYSLSCGGPLMLPDSENFIVTPIAPHNLNVRPIVISDKSEIMFSLEGRSKQYMAALDSRTEIIDADLVLTVKKEKFKVNLVRLKSQDFLNTLRKKLMWGTDLRN